MREIKFRAWHDGEMFENVGINPGAVILFDHSQASRMMEPKEIGYIGIDCDGLFLEQFTGLRDKNGREIYEGDILEESKGYFFEVVYDQEWAKFKLRWRTRAIQYPEWNRGKLMEIIGNVHENPELINA